MASKYATFVSKGFKKQAVKAAAPEGQAKRPGLFSRLGLGRERNFYDVAESRRFATDTAVEQGRLSCLFPKF